MLVDDAQSPRAKIGIEKPDWLKFNPHTAARRVLYALFDALTLYALLCL